MASVATTNRSGLKVHAALDTNTYPKGIKIPDKEMKALEAQQLRRHGFHGDWNYSLLTSADAPPTPKPTRPIARE